MFENDKQEVNQKACLAFELNFYNLMASSSVSFEMTWNASFASRIGNKDDYKFVKKLGEGAFGKVYLAYNQATKQYFATKLMKKQDLVTKNQVRQVYYEKHILICNDFPFLMSLFCYYKDNSTIYLVMRFMEGGEMFVHLKRMARFPEPLAQFYAAQVIMGLLYLHGMDLIYRDVKPENILLDTRGYIKITDFGFAKKVKTRTWTFCGTLDYMAPEMILSKGVNQAADWWGVGILIFEMCAGYAPFSLDGEDKIFTNVSAGIYTIPDHFSIAAEDIIDKFLQANPESRLGMNKDSLHEMCNHPWFSTLDWNGVLDSKTVPSYVPECQGTSSLNALLKKPDLGKEAFLLCTSTEEYPDLFSDF